MRFLRTMRFALLVLLLALAGCRSAPPASDDTTADDAPAIAAAQQHLVTTGLMAPDAAFTTFVRQDGAAWLVTFRVADDFGRRVAVIGTEVTAVEGPGALYEVEVIEVARDEPGVVQDNG